MAHVTPELEAQMRGWRHSFHRRPELAFGVHDTAARVARMLGLDGSCGRALHNSSYDFNDEILGIGASYWTTLVEQQLPLR